MASENNGHWLVLGGAVLWGTTGTAQAFAPSGFDPLIIGTLRLLVGGLVLLPVAWSRGELQTIKSWNLKALVLVTLLTIGYQLCFFSGVAKTGVAVGTVVGIGSAPIIGGLLGRVFRQEILHSRWFIASFLAISGCTLLSLVGSDEVNVDIAGVILAIGAGACYAGMTLGFKGLLTESNTMGVIAVVFCLASVLLLPVLVMKETHWLLQTRSILVVLHLGVAATAVPYILYARGLQTTTVSTATTLTLAEPMTAATLGILVLGEHLNFQAFGGIFLIFGGLAYLVFAEQRMRRRAVV